VEDFGGGENHDGEFEATTGDNVIIGLQKEWQKLELEQLAIWGTVKKYLCEHCD